MLLLSLKTCDIIKSGGSWLDGEDNNRQVFFDLLPPGCGIGIFLYLPQGVQEAREPDSRVAVVAARCKHNMPKINNIIESMMRISTNWLMRRFCDCLMQAWDASNQQYHKMTNENFYHPTSEQVLWLFFCKHNMPKMKNIKESLMKVSNSYWLTTEVLWQCLMHTCWNEHVEMNNIVNYCKQFPCRKWTKS